MLTVTCSALILLAAGCAQAEINVTDYVYWTKADMTAWHQYFPSRLLEQERLTNLRAAATSATVADDMKTSLAATVRFQEQELDTARLIMEGTSAQGCIQGISSYMEKAIDEGLSIYQDCAADVIPKLQRLYTSWAKTNASYHDAYQRSLMGIDGCIRTYPNRDSWGRLRTCVDSWRNNYFTLANSITSNMNGSPAMDIVTQYVAPCVQIAASRVVTKGWLFISMLVQCSKLSENIDSEKYNAQLNTEFQKFVTRNDLNSQIWTSQTYSRSQVSQVEEVMLHYYSIEKSALEKYVIESRNRVYYYSQLRNYLQKYFITLSLTTADNPAEADCISEASSALNDILSDGAEKALVCATQIVNDTKFRISRVNDNFAQINRILPNIGNVAILFCLSEGYIFAENTISNCFSLTLNDFNINITELNTSVAADVEVLLGYEKSFFSNSSLPCGNSILSRATLEAERTLYNLQRCLYISTGTKYAVTTSAPYTTTDAPSTAGVKPETMLIPTTRRQL